MRQQQQKGLILLMLNTGKQHLAPHLVVHPALHVDFSEAVIVAATCGTRKHVSSSIK